MPLMLFEIPCWQIPVEGLGLLILHPVSYKCQIADSFLS